MSTSLARVSVVYTGFAGAPGYSNFYFRRRTGGGWEDYIGQVISRCNDFYEALESIISDAGHWEVQPSVDIINDFTGELEATHIGTALEGDGTGYAAWAPLASGLCIQWLTDGIRNGRHVRGRTFVVPVAADQIAADGGPVGGALTACGNAADALTGSGAEAVVPVIWSRPKYTNATPPVLDVNGTYSNITGNYTKDEFAVLRSRRN